MSGRVADRLDHLAGAAEERGTVGKKVAEPLHEDATFVRAARPAGPRAALTPLLPFALAVGAAFVLDRLRGVGTARKPADRLRSGLATVGKEIAERAWTLGRDTRAEARKQRAWRMLQAGVGAGFTLLARRAAAGAWEGLTGRDAPGRH